MRKLAKQYLTIKNSSFSVSYYFSLFISKSGDHLQVPLLDTEINLTSIPDDFIMYGSDYITNLFLGLEKACGADMNCVMLPYACIDMNKIDGEKDEDDLLLEEED